MNPRGFHLHCDGAYPLPPSKIYGPRAAGTRNVLDCIAEMDLEDIEEMLASCPQPTTQPGVGVVAVRQVRVGDLHGA